MTESSLTELLNHEELTGLTVLISDIMETVTARQIKSLDTIPRKSRILGFGWSSPTIEPSQSTEPISSIQENRNSVYHKDPHEIEGDIAPRIQEIKSAAIASQDAWRTAFFQRIIQATHKEEKSNSTHSNATETPKLNNIPLKPDGLRYWFPPISSSLPSLLTIEKRSLVIHAILLLAISLETYDPRSRTLLLELCCSLHVPVSALLKQESATARVLISSAKSSGNQPEDPTALTADSHVQKRIEEGRSSQRWKVGLATLGGALLVGVTGGLAAPLVAAGLGTLLSGIGLGGTVAAGYLGAMAASGPLIGGLFGAYGGNMSGNMMKRYAEQVQDFAFLPLRPNQESKLRVFVCISGWLTNEDEIVSPWTAFSDYSSVYALRWEKKALLELGTALDTFVRQYAIGYIKSEIIKRTVLASLWSALWPVGLLKLGRVIDNPFNVAKARSDKAGLVLADAIIDRAQGRRPISLVGYSLGARVIYSCLLNLAERKAFGLVENAVLIGAPTPSTTESWALMRSVVGGRLVNVYSAEDWVLGFMYRTSAIQLGVAGLQQVEGVEQVENFDVGDIVDGHLKYSESISQILGRVLDADLASVADR
ncbi:hypothetical protein FRC20_009118 [Serendipita sp. 405]|nr:hypothetical protein FRC15_005694 [Serendipita sp. 397]KAG8872706.1 hypothetical protein FRC20_009118 [Serendipita sp. 405]